MKLEFSLTRFLQTLRWSWQTQPLIPYMVMLGLIPFGYYFLANLAYHQSNLENANDGIFFCLAIMMLLCGWLYAGISFQVLSKNTTGMQYLLLPASVLEKWLAKVIMAFVVFPLILLITFHLALWIFNFFAQSLIVFRYPPVDWEMHEIKIVFFFFYLLMPLAFVSGLLWKRFGFFKTILTGAVLLFLIVQYLIWSDFSNRNGSYRPLISDVVPPFMDFEGTPATKTLVDLFWLFAAYIPATLCFVASYFLLKNKEI
jgi:hypothetical protein